jgi:hypothetical protein
MAHNKHGHEEYYSNNIAYYSIIQFRVCFQINLT